MSIVMGRILGVPQGFATGILVNLRKEASAEASFQGRDEALGF
jgi:hypothetical protein